MIDPSSSRRAMPSGSHQQVVEATPILSECCEQETSCRLQLVHSGHSVHATLQSLSKNGVLLRVALDDHSDELRPHALCCVAFPHRASLCAFLGCLLESHNQDSAGREVVIEMPQLLTVANLRQSFRVPVVHQSGLQVLFRLPDQRELVAEALNIAETGIEVEFAAKDNPPALAAGTAVDVELRFRDELVQLTGEVRRHQGTCAVMFAKPEGDGPQRQVARLHGMVLSLQQLWLKSRLR